MKRSLLPVLALLAVACAGLTARQQALLPAMRLAWGGIRVEVDRGTSAAALAQHEVPAAVAESVAAMETALSTGDPAAMAAANWPMLESWATAGIADQVAKGEISPAVEPSLRERLTNYGASITTYVRR